MGCNCNCNCKNEEESGIKIIGELNIQVVAQEHNGEEFYTIGWSSDSMSGNDNIDDANDLVQEIIDEYKERMEIE